jgi:hypothetical protein
VSLLKAGRRSFEFDGAHVSLNRAGDAQTFTVGKFILQNVTKATKVFSTRRLSYGFGNRFTFVSFVSVRLSSGRSLL